MRNIEKSQHIYETTPGRPERAKVASILPVEPMRAGLLSLVYDSFVMENHEESRPAWLNKGMTHEVAASKGQLPPVSDDRVTIDIWDAVPPWGQDDIFSVVVCVDGEVMGKPLSKHDGCIVCNWLQDALPTLERQLMKEVERLDQLDAEEEYDKRLSNTDEHSSE